MKRSWWTTAAISALLAVVVVAARAQETRKDRDQEPRKDRDEPQQRGMMMRGMMGQGMPMQGMPMQGMMPMMMMMEMHQRHAAMESQWEATDEGVFVLRQDKLLKYDKDLKLVKSVDLPGPPMPMMAHHGGEGHEGGGMPMMMGMGPMRQMMAMMHGTPPSKLAVTSNAVFVSRGSRLLKFGRDLELQKTVDLPEAKPMMCPMCGQMMGHMRGGHDE